MIIGLLNQRSSTAPQRQWPAHVLAVAATASRHGNGAAGGMPCGVAGTVGQGNGGRVSATGECM